MEKFKVRLVKFELNKTQCDTSHQEDFFSVILTKLYQLFQCMKFNGIFENIKAEDLENSDCLLNN